MTYNSLIRPPDIGLLVGGLRFYRDSIFYVFRPLDLPSELSQRNSTKTGHMLRSKCDLKMYARNLGYHPLQIEGPKTTFFEDFTT